MTQLQGHRAPMDNPAYFYLVYIKNFGAKVLPKPWWKVNGYVDTSRCPTINVCDSLLALFRVKRAVFLGRFALASNTRQPKQRRTEKPGGCGNGNRADLYI